MAGVRIFATYPGVPTWVIGVSPKARRGEPVVINLCVAEAQSDGECTKDCKNYVICHPADMQLVEDMVHRWLRIQEGE